MPRSQSGHVSVARFLTAQVTGDWTAGTFTNNPGAGDVMADTGVLAEGDYFFSFLLMSTVDSLMRLALRNAANDTDLRSFDCPVPASVPIELTFGNKLFLEMSERIRVTMVNAIVGDAQVSIFATEYQKGARS